MKKNFSDRKSPSATMAGDDRQIDGAALASIGVNIFAFDHGLIRAVSGNDGALVAAFNELDLRQALRLVEASDRRKVIESIHAAQHSGSAAVEIGLCPSPDDQMLYIRLGLECASEGSEGPIWRIFTVDRTNDVSAKERYQAEADHLRNIVEYNPQLPWIADPQGNVLDFTDRWLNATGMSRDEAAGEGWQGATHPDDIERVAREIAEACEQKKPFDTRTRLDVNGEYRWMRAQGYPKFDENGEILCFYGYTEDIHESVLVEDQIRWSAEHDSLTELPNRAVFNKRLEEAFSTAMTSLKKVGLLLIDLDNFKEVNDLMGHQAGDELLCAFSETLKAGIPDGATIARLGGDEFGVLLPEVDNLQELVSVGEKLLSYSGTFSGAGRTADCRASIGACIFPDHGTTPTTLLRQADLALYRAKSLGRARLQVFEASMLHEMQERVAMVNRARSAVRDGSVLTYYQPKVNLATGKLAGFEALLRWRDNNGKIRLPGEIYAAFDDAEVSEMLGQIMIDRVFDDICSWRDEDIDAGKIAVNVSAPEIRRPDFVPRLLANMERAGLAPDQIEIELTEGIFLGAGAEAARNAINQLNEANVPMALDDFGTGFASLSHLRLLPVKTLKIDRSFVSGMTRSKHDSAIIHAIIAMGRAMDLEIVAEGIETAEQAEILRRRKCELGQGYYFGRPTPSEEIPEFIAKWNGDPQPSSKKPLLHASY